MENHGGNDESPSSNEAFFVALFQKYSKLIFHVAKRYQTQGVDIQDIVQESLMNLLSHESLLKTLSAEVLTSYIYYTVKNTAISQLRSRQKIISNEFSLEESESELLHNSTAIIQQIEMKTMIEPVLDSLPENERMLLTYKYLLDYSNSEIARLIGCKPESVRMMLSRARRKALCLLEGSKEEMK